MFVIMTTFNYIRHTDSLGLYLIINAIIWPIGGYIWGIWMWAVSERAYKKYMQQSSLSKFAIFQPM